MTVPRATRCNRRVAPGRLSPAAPSGRGNPPGGHDGRARPFEGSHPRAQAGPPSPCPRPRSVRAHRRRRRRPPPAVAPPVPRKRRRRHRRGAIVLHPFWLRRSRPRRRPPIAPVGLCPPRPRRDRPPTSSWSRPPRPWRSRLRLTLRRGLFRRLPHRRRRDRRGHGRPSRRARRHRLACGCRTTPTVVSGGNRPARRVRRRRPVGVGPRRPRRLLWERAPPRREAGVPRSRRRNGRRCWGRRPPFSHHGRRRPPSERGSPR